MDPGSGRGEQLRLKYQMKEARFIYSQNTEVFLVTVCGIELLELKHADFFFLSGTGAGRGRQRERQKKRLQTKLEELKRKGFVVYVCRFGPQRHRHDSDPLTVMCESQRQGSPLKRKPLHENNALQGRGHLPI